MTDGKRGARLGGSVFGPISSGSSVKGHQSCAPNPSERIAKRMFWQNSAN